ncbi:hypothetical protein NQZ68_011999 [Dissostichus eleginoides]|nr:hypothetical protein NQZ68_011999 [Dissostichus eleginoides]
MALAELANDANTAKANAESFVLCQYVDVPVGSPCVPDPLLVLYATRHIADITTQGSPVAVRNRRSRAHRDRKSETLQRKVEAGKRLFRDLLAAPIANRHELTIITMRGVTKPVTATDLIGLTSAAETRGCKQESTATPEILNFLTYLHFLS